jgi:hypothetical protein
MINRLMTIKFPICLCQFDNLIEEKVLNILLDHFFRQFIMQRFIKYKEFPLGVLVVSHPEVGELFRVLVFFCSGTIVFVLLEDFPYAFFF